MTTLHERVTTLEAWAFRTRQHEPALRNAAEQTATHEVRAEIVPRLDRLENGQQALAGHVAGLKRGVSALLAHFGIETPGADPGTDASPAR